MTLQPMTHEEALELAGLYTLDALTPDEKAQVDDHIQHCAEDHSEIVALGAVTPALATLAPPIESPPGLKGNVMAAYRAEVALQESPGAKAAQAPVQEPRPTRPVVVPVAPRSTRWAMPSWFGWAAAAAAVLIVAVVGVYALGERSQLDQANQRAQEISQAIAAMTAPGSQVAVLHGSGAAAGINGFVAIPADGSGYMVMTDVPPAPAGKTYQAWFIADGKPSSAGTMAAEPNGNVVAAGIEPVPGTSVVAVTVEPAGGSAQPTSDPIIVGNLTTAS